MACLKINNTLYPYEQLRIEIPPMDLTQWLPIQTLYPKIYWRDRDAHSEHAAIGNILSFSSPPIFDILPDDDVRFYGGMQFPSAKQEQLWEGFSQSAFWLPCFEVIQTKKSTQLLLHFCKEKASETAIEKLRFEKFYQTSACMPCHLLKATDSLSFTQWETDISHLLTMMKKQRVQKVVLGRKREILLSTLPSAWHMVEKLKAKAYAATVFAFQMKQNTTFLGASPEKLFHRRGQHVSMDAVAGTRKRGRSEEEDLLLAKELNSHPKEKREFLFVKEFIQNTAHLLGEKCTWHTSDTILKTAYVQHLYNQSSITLKKGITDCQLIAALHPTPAVGGVPQDKALELIWQLESFQRGWYAAPVGWISPYETHLIVAIRSCLLQDAVLHLFGASGIVAESIAEKEWEEIDHKMNICLHAL